jgi:hypothetical protein
VDLEAHAVARAVQEGVAPTRLGDDRPARFVDRFRFGSAGDRGHPAALALGHHLGHAGFDRRRGLAHAEGAGHVRAVAVHHRPEVDHDQLALGDVAVAGPGMGLGPVGARRHNRLERGTVRAPRPHLVVESQGHVALGGAAGQHRPHDGEGLVGHPRRFGHARDLAVVLDPPEGFDQSLGGDELRTRKPVLGEAPVLGPRDRLRLQPEPGGAGHGSGDDAPLLRGRAPDSDLGGHTGTGELLVRLLAVAAVGHEEEGVGEHQQQPGRSGETGEIPDVHHAGDEHGVASRGLEPLTEVGHPGGDVHGRERSRRHANNLATARSASS